MSGGFRTSAAGCRRCRLTISRHFFIAVRTDIKVSERFVRTSSREDARISLRSEDVVVPIGLVLEIGAKNAAAARNVIQIDTHPIGREPAEVEPRDEVVLLVTRHGNAGLRTLDLGSDLPFLQAR
jgi:hypothetical protein